MNDIDTLTEDELAELADESLPGGRHGIMFAWFLRARQRKLDDRNVRPILERAMGYRRPRHAEREPGDEDF